MVIFDADSTAAALYFAQTNCGTPVSGETVVLMCTALLEGEWRMS